MKLLNLIVCLFIFSISLTVKVNAKTVETVVVENTEEEYENTDIIVDSTHPFYPYALKKNGKLRRKFTIPYVTLKSYLVDYIPSPVKYNESHKKLLSIDNEVLENQNIEDLEFTVDLKLNKIFLKNQELSPDSISELFQVIPDKYIKKYEAEDFLSAKRKVYENIPFKKKKLKYKLETAQLESWRSLNHPPVFDLGSDLTVWDKDYTKIDYKNTKSIFYSEIFQKKIDSISESELSFGNKLELLNNGDSFQRKLTEIKNAKKSVLIAVMSFYCDESTRPLEDLLIQKVNEGVDVKIMVEKVWTKLIMKRCMRRIDQAGIDVVYANDLLKKGEESALFHDKFMIFDEKKMIMGGENLVASDNISTGFNNMNRDNDIYIEGPAVSDAVISYSKLWGYYLKNRNLLNIKNESERVKPIEFYANSARNAIDFQRSNTERGENNYKKILTNPRLKNLGVCRFINQSPEEDKHKLTKVFMELIDQVENRLNMTTGSIMFNLPDKNKDDNFDDKIIDNTDDGSQGIAEDITENNLKDQNIEIAKKEDWNAKLFEHIFAASNRGVKLDIIGNGIDGGYGEISNMLGLAKAKIRFKFKPIRKLFYKFLLDYLNFGAAKKNDPYLEYIEDQPNARVWTNFQYMHSKLIQIDRILNIVSSYNLEKWSANKSHEAALICMDEKLSNQMDRSFLRDFVNSVPTPNAKGVR